MMIPTLTLLAAAVQPLAVQQEVRIQFAPDSGVSLDKVVSTRHSLISQGFRRTIGSESEIIPLPIKLESSQRVVVSDQYVASRGGRPVTLRRYYKGGNVESKLGSTVDENLPVSVVDLPSQIKDASVVFTWVPEEEAYGRYYDGAELPERWLPGLAFDMDALELLPAEPVPIGGSWKVEAGELRGLFSTFAGQRYEEAPRGTDRMLLRTLGAGIGANLHRVVSGECTGGAELTLEKVDAGLATIQISINRISVINDLTDYMQGEDLRREKEAGVDAQAGRMAVDFSGRGTMVWNLEAGHLQELKIALQENATMGAKMVVENQEEEIWDELILAGTLILSIECEPGSLPEAPGPRR